MATINVNLRKEIDNSYNIVVARGLFGRIPTQLKRLNIGEKYAIISDKKVGKLYGEKLLKEMKDHGHEAHLFTFEGSDKHKTFPTAQKLIDQMLAKKYARGDAIIALGGGVPGDLAGLIASVYMRGIRFVHVPTTLLAMVDSSIGGKTGVNVPAGKNLIGTFFQPRMVLIDPNLLKTLPESEFRNGLSEMVKYGIIADEKLFHSLETKASRLNRSSSPVLNKLIEQCCQIKASIVEKDEMENDLRMTLNYGHTIGHAIESLTKYKVPHGEAIAIGMKTINIIAYNKDLLDEKDHLRINKLIADLALGPENLSILSDSDSAQQLWEIISNDKKTKDGKPTFIVATSIGKTKTTQDITLTDLKNALKQL